MQNTDKIASFVIWTAKEKKKKNMSECDSLIHYADYI